MDYKEWLNNNDLAISIWEKKYQYDGETFEQWLDRVSDGDKEIRQLIIDKKFLFGGRILANRGLERLGKKVTNSNCYVLELEDDSIEAIYKACSDLARTFSYGGGVGLDISRLRPRGMKVNNSSKYTTGACSFMDTFSQVTSTIGQNGRRGALMLSIDCKHPDLEEFISIKNDLDRVTKANISVRITDDFMRAVRDDKEWELSFTTEHGDTLHKVVKAKEIFHLLCKNNYDYAEPGILFWDTIEGYNLLSNDNEFRYAGVNPCAEEPLPAGGSCLLGSINLSEYVTDNTFNLGDLIKDIPIIVRAMNDVLDQGLPLHPLQIQRDTVRDWRQIGIGVMGIADMLIKLGLKYDSDEAIEFCDELAWYIANETIKASALLAKDHGPYPKYNNNVLESTYLIENTEFDTVDLVKQYGLRNSQLLTIAPTGSLSTMLGISGGIEPIFSLSYTRKTQSLHGEDVYYKVFTPIAENYMKEHNLKEEEDLPEFFVTAQKMNALFRVKMQAVWQRHIDASISSTVNLPNETTVDKVEELYMAAWEHGLKGMTIFRDGCKRVAVLTTGDKKEESKEEVQETIPHGTWLPRPDDTIYILKKITTGCSRFNAFIGWSESEQRVVDLFVRHCSQHGCKSNIDTIAIAFSGMLRLGGKVEYIEKALNGVGICNSYTMAKHKGKPVSKGTSCGTAILNAIKEVEQEQLGLVKKKEVKKQPVDIMGMMTKSMKCPECGANIQASGGCFTCSNCGFSKCD